MPTKHNPYFYRADIDGLRALAVLSVVLYHAFPNRFHGGFIGVDVFFVISGFLITSIILNGVTNDAFSFLTFYSRRIKRIFPALIVVIIFSLMMGWFILLPGEYKQLGKHVAGGAGFISNFVLWHESGYFDAAAGTKILLHLWSLAIEEQYYLIWPALIFFAYKRKYNLAFIFIFLMLLSFWHNVHLVKTHEIAAFYSPLSRCWELLAGSLIAYFTLNYKPSQSFLIFKQSIFLQNMLPLMGLFLILLGEKLITKALLFPGWWALLPIIGTSFILLSYPNSWVNQYILSHRILVSIGLISYPLYLWHWPLLALARNQTDQLLTIEARLIIVVASLVFACLTYHIIEKPIRFGNRLRFQAPILCLLMLLIGCFGFYDYKQNGLVGYRMQDKFDYDAYFDGYFHDQTKFVVEREQIGQDQCNRFDYLSHWGNKAPRPNISPECYTKHTKKSILLWGDSHAAHLYYGLTQILPKDISVLLVFSSSCTPHPVNLKRIHDDYCEMSNYSALNVAKKEVPEVVILAASGSFDINYIRQLSHQLKQFGVKKIFVMGEVPHWKPFLYKLILKDYWYHTPHRILGHQNQDMLSLDQAFRAQLKPNEEFEYVNLFHFFCNQRGCMTYFGNNKRDNLITLDDAHLRPFASVYLAKNLLVPLILRQYQTQKVYKLG